MTPLPAKYRDITDHCVRCPGHPTVAPDGKGAGTDATSVVLGYRCEAGHGWERTFRRSALKQGPINVSAARRQHLATTAAATAATDNDNADDCTDRNRAGRQPGPRTGWCPDRR